ncbi:MAG: valine--tRNA ligase [Firmicutes bacterium]|nr:valine--tRNA ligase [Bacillota bacterium]
MKDLATKYDHTTVENGKYDHWISKGYFRAGDKSKDPFTIVIPPPNVTGKLHLGHAWDNTLQDIIARYKRLKGYDMLYLPGMDHAGIATQAKVDQRLKSQGISRYDLGREKYLEKAWEWKEEYSNFIRKQWARLGNSLDYSRERFTLDEGLNKAVIKVFVDLYKEGLIYQGYRIINWDPEARTALSNVEVIHQDDPGKMYYFKYQCVELDETFTIATTRPETMFGDVCIVVHPDDTRYQHLIGKHAVNPANGEKLPIIADDYIDIEFGTGVMKCTPAHDPNDYQIAIRHNLAMPICMNPDGTMNELCGEFNGLDRYDARAKVTKKIEEEGNLVKIEDIIHPVGHSERTNAVVEPYLSKQWFVKMKPLAQEVLKYQQDSDKKINFYPERFEKTFIQWLENIEDWCISRQLWWGHRIPVYYHKDTNEIYCEYEPPKDIENYVQDEDVLDTWFSSALWPFSTLGWPNDTDDLKRYYPTDTMVTGYDIIFFWVARMAFQARYFTHSRPFKDCLIHGLIRDAQGRKMSKTLGNGIDPMDVIDQYGVDALRFFLTTNSTPGQDMRYIDEKVEASWNFINKIWNATRFCLLNLDDSFTNETIKDVTLSNIDKWIIKRYNETLASISNNMDKYEFALVGNEIYSFIWDDFCSWYIELSKSNLNSEDTKVKHATQATLYYVLHGIIRMISPFMPFVAEELYLALPNTKESVNLETWPNADIEIVEACDDVKQLISIIKTIREVKVENNLKPSFELDIMLKDNDNNIIEVNDDYINIIAKMIKCHIVNNIEGNTTIRPIFNGSITINSDALCNKEEEIAKFEKEKTRLEAEIKRSTNMLSNEKFIAKAPAAKVEEEKNKLANYQNQYNLVINRLEQLKK